MTRAPPESEMSELPRELSSYQDYIDGFFAHDGKIVDKWEQYLPIYFGEYARFARDGRPVRLLEIGVQNGGSLELWAKHLPPGSEILGVDIDPKVDELSFSGNIRAIVADSNDTERLAAELGPEPFDIIIDDGSHRSGDITRAFRFLFDRLKPGGIYVVEDLHAAYYPSHEGGFRLRTSAIEYFKDLIDALHTDYFMPWADIERGEFERLLNFNRWLGRISFYDSIVVVEKLGREKMLPYRRYLSGGTWSVVNPTDGLLEAPPAMLEGMRLGKATAGMVDLDLKHRVETVVAPQRELERLRTEHEELLARFAAAGRETAALHAERPGLDERNKQQAREFDGERQELVTRNLQLEDKLRHADRRIEWHEAERQQLRRERRQLLDHIAALKGADAEGGEAVRQAGD